mgnify:CR=1 FL=1
MNICAKFGRILIDNILNMNVNSMLRWYIDNNIKPKKEENELIANYYNKISNLLEDNWYYCFRSWSYARWTAISPVNDLDIICESDENDIDDFMNSEKWKWLYEILSKEYWDENIDFQSSSIWISFWPDEDDFGIDVVIALKDEEVNNYWDNLYTVPKLLYKTRKQRKEIYKNIKENWENKDYLSLIKSDPKWYKKELKEIKDENKNIIYATRFLKKWKWVIKKEYWENEKCLKSFHIEEIVKKTIKWNMKLELLDLLKEAIKTFDLTKSNIPDRASASIMIDSYIDEDDFNQKQNEQQLERILYFLEEINENNFEEKIIEIFNQKIKKIETKIDNKQKSYYVTN